MNRDYLHGATPRAKKMALPYLYSDEMLAGYNDMQGLLSPIETKIQLAVLEWSAVATKRIKEINEQIAELEQKDSGSNQQASLPRANDLIQGLPEPL